VQGVENSELGYVPARQTTVLHGGARKWDGGSEKPTDDGQHNIRLQEAAVRAQPGDASSLVVQCCFVLLLNRCWGIVTVPGSFLKAGDLGWPDPHPLH